MIRASIAVALLAAACGSAQGQACFRTTVVAPSPLMGNHGEIFRTAEGVVFEVVGSYEYLYAYYPQVTICPERGKMMVEGQTVGISVIRPAQRATSTQIGKKPGIERPDRKRPTDAPVAVVLRVRGCDYFIADGPRGLYLLEWYGGYDPEIGDGILGDVGGYGFKDILYSGGQDGRVYVDDYLLSKGSALEKLRDKCR